MLLDLYDRVLQKYPEGIGTRSVLDVIEEIKSEIYLSSKKTNNEEKKYI